MILFRRKRESMKELERRLKERLDEAIMDLIEALEESSTNFEIYERRLRDGRIVYLFMIGNLSEEERRKAIEAYMKAEEKSGGAAWLTYVRQ